MCTAEGRVLGTRARRQAKAAAGPLYIPASHLHAPWSDLDFCFTPSPRSVPLFTRSSGPFQLGAQSQEQIRL